MLKFFAREIKTCNKQLNTIALINCKIETEELSKKFKAIRIERKRGYII